MSAITAEYRVTVYGSDDVTPLTPRSGAAHSDSFQVNDTSGVSGWQPYLMQSDSEPKTGIDRLTGEFEVGQDVCYILDAKVASDNAERWVTAFLGDDLGRSRLKGALYVREERLTIDGVVGSWTDYFTGRVSEVLAPEPTERGPVIGIIVTDPRIGTMRDVFIGAPHHSITYAHGCPLLPIGVQEDWGGVVKAERITGTIDYATVGTALRWGILESRDRKLYKLTAALQRIADYRRSSGEIGPSTFCPHARVRIKRTDTSAEGDFWLAPVALDVSSYFGYDGEANSPVWIVPGTEPKDKNEVRAIGIKALPSTHPQYMAMPPDGTEVEFYVYNAGPPTPDAPLLIDDVEVGTLVSDMAAGKFSLLNDTGLPDDTNDGTVAVTPIDVDATTMGALTQKLRFAVDQVWRFDAFLAQQVSQVTHTAFPVHGDGVMYGRDLRLDPATATGLTTIGADDVIDASWSIGRDTVDTIMVTTYSDIGKAYLESEADALDAPCHGIKAEPRREITLLDHRVQGKPNVLRIDAQGIRADSGIGRPLRGTDPRAATLDDLSTQDRSRDLARHYRDMFVDGAATADLRCLLTTNTDKWPGQWTLVDVDSIPNLASNERGGVRVMLVTERQRTRTGIRLRTIDAGANSVAVVPTVATPAQDPNNTTGGITVAVTLNASDERAVLQTATTATSEVSAPADDSADWITRAELTSSATVIVGGLQSGSRHWVRAFTATPGKLPSDYADPAGTKFADTASLAAFTSFTLELNDDGTVTATWTVNSITLGVRLYYGSHSPTETPTLTSFIDVDAADGTYVFTSSQAVGEMFSVDAVAYTGWTDPDVSGTAGETRRRSVAIPVIEDTTVAPSITLTLTEINETAGKYVQGAVALGVSAARWRVWDKDGGWPTTDATETGPLDEQHLAGEFGAAVRSYKATAKAGVTRHAIAIAYTASGKAGVRDSDSIVVSSGGVASEAGALSSLVWSEDGSNQVMLQWDHNQTIEDDGASRWLIDIYRDGTILVADRSPKTDTSGTVALEGSYTDVHVRTCAPSGALPSCTFQSFTYSIVLKDTTAVVSDVTYTVPVSGYLEVIP